MRAILFAVILACSILIVPVAASVVQNSWQRLGASCFKLNFDNFNWFFDELVMRQEEPGSGGGGTGVL